MSRFALIFIAIAPAVTCGVMAEPDATSSTRARHLATGLALWRKPGAIQNGAACATCHSPDGIDIAAYSFSDADIERRARPHLSASDGRALVQYIHELRQVRHLTKLRDPNQDRPLQPGGIVLPGATPEARDYRFGQELEQKLPLLTHGHITTIEDARRAEAQLLHLDVTNLPCGIPLNRLSEDVAHGNEHSSIAQWLPEEPPTIAATDLRKWYAAEDRYLANPSTQQLHELLLLHTQLVNRNVMVGFDALSVAKFRALLVFQDRIRRRSEQTPAALSPDVAAYGNFNPIWDVGEVSRQLVDRTPDALGMGADERGKKLAGPALADQLHALRVSWFWAGWLSDQGMFRTAMGDKTRLGLWLSESLSKDGPYPIHSVFANARRQAVVSNIVSAWGETPERRRRIWDFAGLRSFMFYVRDMPQEAAYRNLYIRFTANCFIMNLLLLEADIMRTHVVWLKRNSKGNVAELVKFVEQYDPSSQALAHALQGRLDSLIDSAVERT